MDNLFAAQQDFTVIDSRTLAEAKVDGGALVHGQLRWHVLVLPGVDTLPQAAWENLARFVRHGGVVIALGALPMNSETEFPSPTVQSLARNVFGAVTTGYSVKSGWRGHLSAGRHRGFVAHFTGRGVGAQRDCSRGALAGAGHAPPH